MGFEQRRDIGRHDRDRIAATDAAPCQCRGEPPASRLEFAIRVRLSTVAHGDLVRPDERAAREKLYRRERNIVRALFAERIAERLAAYHEAGADSVAVVPSTAEDSGGREVFGAIATSSGLVERT